MLAALLAHEPPHWRMLQWPRMTALPGRFCIGHPFGCPLILGEQGRLERRTCAPSMNAFGTRLKATEFSDEACCRIPPQRPASNVAGDENGWVASTTNMMSAVSPDVPALNTS